MAKEESYATEAEMCAQFIAEIGEDWIAYPETEGWDILLVRKADGFQIGVEAKLRLNGKVMTQALEEWYTFSGSERAGPDCRAVLVPEGKTGNLSRVAAYVGLTVVTIRKPAPSGGWYTHGNRAQFTPALPTDRKYENPCAWHELCPAKRHELPEYVPDVPAGDAAPVQLTKWKIAAIKIAVLLEKRGFVARSDFKHLNIDHRRWLPHEGGWLTLNDNGFVAGPRLPDFKRQHPRVYDEIAADFDQWKPADPLPRQKQHSLQI